MAAVVQNTRAPTWHTHTHTTIITLWTVSHLPPPRVCVQRAQLVTSDACLLEHIAGRKAVNQLHGCSTAAGKQPEITHQVALQSTQ